MNAVVPEDNVGGFGLLIPQADLYLFIHTPIRGLLLQHPSLIRMDGVPCACVPRAPCPVQPSPSHVWVPNVPNVILVSGAVSVFGGCELLREVVMTLSAPGSKHS